MGLKYSYKRSYFILKSFDFWSIIFIQSLTEIFFFHNLYALEKIKTYTKSQKIQKKYRIYEYLRCSILKTYSDKVVGGIIPTWYFLFDAMVSIFNFNHLYTI